MTRTDFMSLPAELRLRIHEYALDPRPGTGAFGRSRLGKGNTDQDCCALNPRKNARRCNCTRNKITTGLLRANKEVSYGALPVLYNLFELRVRIPSSDGPVKTKELSNILDKISEHAQQHIRQLLLVSENASGHDFVTLYRDHRNRGARMMQWRSYPYA